MMWLSWRTLRARWPVFLGTFLALAFGVCLMATTLLCIAGTQKSGDATDDWLTSVAITLLGNAAGVSGAAAIFVVAGTFSFAVAQRRRELALLRVVGATPRQTRRLIMSESLLVGAVSAVFGCVLGILVAPYFAQWMARVDLAPPGFAPHVTWWPLVAAGAVGLLSAFLSAWIASRRASKVRPIEALFETSIDRRTMTLARWIAAGAFLSGAALLMPLITSASSGIASAYILLEVLLLIFGVTMLVPVFAPLLIRLVGWPLAGPVAELSRANTTTSLRRTSSTIAPIFITMALAAASFASIATLAAIRSQALQDRVKAPLIVVNDDGLSADAMAALAQSADGAVIEPTAKSSVLLAKNSDRNSDRLVALYVQPSIDRALRLPLAQGNIFELAHADTMAVSEQMATSHDWPLGSRATVWSAGGDRLSLKIVAIIKDSDDLDGTILLPDALRQRVEPQLRHDTIYATPSASATTKQLQSTLQSVAASYGAQVEPTAEYLAEQDRGDARIDRVALLTVVGLAVLYTAISIVNTCVMSITGRFRDFSVLQLSGATHRQILRMVALETLLIAFIAALAAGAVMAAALAITYASATNPVIVIPWAEVGAIVAACVVIALTTSIVATLWAFRTPAIRIAASRE
jgi:putative ABC transport system permease protein